MFKVSRHWPLRLRPYEIQNVAFERGIERHEFGLWLEQGIGKTLVNCAEFIHFVLADVVDCNIVILPSYLKTGWEDEIRKYGLDVPTVTWPDRLLPKQELRPFIFVINTEAVRTSGGLYVENLLKRHRCMITVDESTCIANFKSSTAKRVLGLAPYAKVRRALSGLPAPENVTQWWPQLRFCGALQGTSPYAFRNRFAVMGGYMGKDVVGTRNEDELHEIIDGCSIRALKRDWLDLPEKVYMPPLSFDLTARQLEAYKSMQAEFFAEVDSGEAVFADMVIHQMMKLQQISRGFMLDNGRVIELVAPDDNPAIRTLLSALSTTRGKTIVFTYFEYSTRTVFERLMKHGIECRVLRGRLTKDEIAERKRDFNEDPKVRVLVGQLSVTSKGHTLLGGEGDDRCSTSIYYENVFSRETRSQSEDRNHRIGQDRGVSYFDLMENVRGSQTKRAIEALQKKQNFIEAIVNAIRTRRR